MIKHRFQFVLKFSNNHDYLSYIAWRDDVKNDIENYYHSIDETKTDGKFPATFNCVVYASLDQIEFIKKSQLFVSEWEPPVSGTITNV
jgi:hypothetical protein